MNQTLIRDLNDNWTTWLAERGIAVAEFDADLPVQPYGDAYPADSWLPGAHLAVHLDRELACPVDVDGWTNAVEVGWDRVAELAAAGSLAPRH